MNKMIHLRVPEGLYSKAADLSKVCGFSNVQEFIRDSVRKAVEEYELQQAFKRLDSYKGAAKQGSPISKRELTMKAQKDILKEFE